MKHIKIYTFLFSCIFSLQLFAGIVPIETARTVAKNAFYERASLGRKSLPGPLSISGEFIIGDNNIPILYVFNFQDEKGFVILSAEDRVQPLLGYSFNGAYGGHTSSPAFRDLIDHFSQGIRTARIGKSQVDPKVAAAWKNYASTTSFQALKNILSVSPLTTTTWDQGCHYNDSCPSDPGGPCNHAVTGCVATCIAQIIKYHAFPQHGSGFHSYISNLYGVRHANFGTATYNYTSMPDNVTSPNAAVAQLIYHCGVGVDMDYSAWASGAPSENAAMALIHFFNYSSGLQLLQKADYTTTAWNNLLVAELNASRPVYMAGYNPSEGHAFVCDGYQGTDYFHFNWGWSGSDNGYFYLNDLSPGGGSMNFNDNQEMIIGITPGVAAACSGSTTLTTQTGNFNDGSYASSYQNNADCQWLIQPAIPAAYIQLTFETFATEAANDLVSVYDGPTTASPLIGTFSGTSMPSVLSSSGNSMLVKFTSNASVTAAGWSAHYDSKYCYPDDTLTGSGGTFSDGSGSAKYSNNTDCYWLIKPPANMVILLQFPTFHTENGYDFVKVYDGHDTLAPLLSALSGDTTAPAVISSGGELFVHFTSDQGVVSDGWQAVWSTNVGVQSGHNAQSMIVLYPNPATDKTNLILKGNFSGEVPVQISDLAGKKVRSFTFTKSSANLNVTVDLSDLKAGYYLLSAQPGNENFVKPLIIR